MRHGRPIAVVEPARTNGGALVKQLLRHHRTDEAWSQDLAEVRQVLTVDVRS